MKEFQPPRRTVQLLEWFCDPAIIEGILGDLEESFYENITTYSATRARWTYRWQAIGFLRWAFKRKHQNNLVMTAMWMNYFRTAGRSMMRNKQFFTINLLGLVFAIACTLFTYLYVQDEVKYDTFLADKDQVYRLYKRHVYEREGIDHLTAETSGLMGPTMQTEYPEVLEAVRVCPWWDKVALHRDDKTAYSSSWYFVDSTFLEVFNYNLVSGDPATALSQPRSLALSQSLAQQMFPDQDPVGATVVGYNDLGYVVTAVFEDVPRHSTLQFDALVSWSTTVPNVGPLAMSWMNNWLAQGIFTFVKLQPGANPAALVDKLPNMMSRFFPERADRYFLKLQPFADVHMHSENLRNQRGMALGSMRFVYLLIFSSILIVLIVTVNYINITLSRAVENKLEVGVRKVLGSSRRQLVGRFIVETFTSTIMASVIAILILAVLIPSINQVTGKQLPVTVLYSWPTLGAVFMLSAVFSLLMGLYPAMVLAKPHVSDVLRSGMARSRGTGLVRKSLLGVQYTIATILIIGTMAVYKQTQHLKNKPLGFDKQNVVVVNIENEIGQKADVFEAELQAHANIESISVGRSALGAGSYSTTFIPEGGTEEVGTRIFIVDAEFFETYGMKIDVGRSFLKKSRADSTNVIVNQSMVDLLQWDDPTSQKLKSTDGHSVYPVIGVVDDFHYNSLATATIEPMAIFLSSPGQERNVSIRLGDGDLNETLAHMQQSWAKFATKTPFEYYFVDQWFDDLYVEEIQLVKTTSLYAIICIMLCALGLYGLTSLMLGQRVREIGIRKILGANTGSIIGLMGRQFLPIILVSLIIAVPISNAIIGNWLAQFAYGVHPGFGVFLLAAGIILVMSVMIVSGLSARVASLNPSNTVNSQQYRLAIKKG